MSDEKNCEEFSVGLKVVRSHVFANEDLGYYRSLSQDTNPLYSDTKFVAHTVFLKPVVPAGMVTAMFDGLVGSRLPGLGAVLVFQEYNFYRPIYFLQEVEFSVELVELEIAKGVFHLDFRCEDQDGEMLVSGRAVVLKRLNLSGIN